MRKLLTLFLLSFVCVTATPAQEDTTKPNVVWITIDDCGPDFGCYGKEVVATPHLDRLAANGQRFERCFASTPVCSPVRSAWITGCYATTIGAHQHRSKRELPEGIRPLPHLLRDAGWRPTYLPHQKVSPVEFARGVEVENGRFPAVSASNKTDYNFHRGREKQPLFERWDEAKKSEPFFGMIDFHAPKTKQGTGKAHRWAVASDGVVDPAQLELPPYWLDAPAVRAAYARYFEGVALFDAEVGALLAWLDREGLRANTLIFVVGDHGLAMLRHKQWCYDTGLRVPLIVSGPGIVPAVRSNLVSTIDLAAATLAYCGIAIPAWMEGQDFLVPEAAERTHLFASRDRCDESEDRVRAMRTPRWKLIRNLRPELTWVGRNDYTRRTFPNVELLLSLKKEKGLTPQQALLLADTKPAWELYDLERDPLELRNRADDPAHAERLVELRRILDAWIEETDADNPFPEWLETITPDKARKAVEERRG